jgi:hypothetical protein
MLTCSFYNVAKLELNMMQIHLSHDAFAARVKLFSEDNPYIKPEIGKAVPVEKVGFV